MNFQRNFFIFNAVQYTGPIQSNPLQNLPRYNLLVRCGALKSTDKSNKFSCVGVGLVALFGANPMALIDIFVYLGKFFFFIMITVFFFKL
jgi:hypothetical protein